MKVASAEAAAAERVRREKSRRSLTAFGEYVQPWWKPAAHHSLVAGYLEMVETYIRTQGANGIGRLIVQMPPRHGKTELVSRIFPAWLLGRQPDSRVILTAYGADLASDNSRAVRNIVMGDKYAAVFGGRSVADAPVELSEDSRAKSNWDIAAPHRGGVVAAGVGGGITGKGAHLMVIDDPFKSREDADSEVYRRRVMQWYGSSVYTRLEQGGAIVIMHTRWHREDLIGNLIKAQAADPMADRWVVVSLPAIALEEAEYAQDDEEQARAMLDGLWIDRCDPLDREPGTALWPSKYDKDVLSKVRSNLENTTGLMDWYALYQQAPRPSEGMFFSFKDFEMIDRAPEGLFWVRYCDLAISQKATADWNASVAVAMDEEGTVYLRDMVRVRGWQEFRERVVWTMLSPEEQGTVWGIEDVAFQALAFQELMRDSRLAGVAMRAVRPEGDKVTRARPLQTRASMGKLKLVRGTWNQAFIQEMLDFPTGAHDDQVDSASGGLQMIGQNSMAKVLWAL